MTIIIAPSPQAVNWFTFVVLLSKTALGVQGFGPALFSIAHVLRLRPVVEQVRDEGDEAYRGGQDPTEPELQHDLGGRSR
jgi:hypothetical protein